MGCCSSSLVDQDLLATSAHDDHSTTPSAYYNKSRPFKKVGLMWTSDIPITETQLEQKRFSYWESAPTYGVCFNQRHAFFKIFIIIFREESRFGRPYKLLSLKQMC